MSGPIGSRKALQTLDALRERILDGTWPVNSQIPREPELMELIGVGKSTIREAVRSLASQGILEPIKGVGTFVRSRTPVVGVIEDLISARPVVEVLGLRRALEVEAARKAAERHSDSHLNLLDASHHSDEVAASSVQVPRELGHIPGSFHHLVMESSGNELMASLFASVMGKLREAREAGEIVVLASDDERVADHAAILSAIRAGDADAAGRAMATHIDRDLVLAENGHGVGLREGACIHL